MTDVEGDGDDDEGNDSETLTVTVAVKVGVAAPGAMTGSEQMTGPGPSFLPLITMGSGRKTDWRK